MLIRREVFAKLDGHPAVRPFNNDIGMDASLNQHMKTYFDTAVREGRYYSEDWTFCENWRDLGGEVYIDKRVLLRHVGTYVFDGLGQSKLFQDLKNVINPVDQAQPERLVEEDQKLATIYVDTTGQGEIIASSEAVPDSNPA
jgi:hypothetical protein